MIRFVVAGALASWGLALPLSAVGETDLVRLKNGRYLSGQVVVDEADREGFKVHRWDNGGVVYVRWTQIPDAERNRLLNKQPEAPVTGVMLDGIRAATAQRDVVGLLIKEDATTLHVKTRDSKSPVPVPKAALLKPYETSKIPEAEAYSPEEMVDLRAAKVGDKDYAGLVETGRFAGRLKLYDRAKELYQKAATADASKKEEIEGILAANEILIRETKAAAALAAVKELAGETEFAKAVEAAKKLVQEFGDTEVVKQNRDLPAQVEKQAKDFEGKKAEFLAGNVPDAYKGKRLSLFTLYSSSKYKVAEAITLANKIDDVVVADLAKKFKSSPEEIQAAWAKRELKQRTVSYGDGTWIVKGGQDGGLDTDAKSQPKQPPPGGNNRGGGFGVPGNRNQPQQKPAELGKKLETKDEWWQNASMSDRKAFVEAEYAKNSAAVKKEIKTRKCSVCNGEGIRKETRQGVACECKCVRCHGVKEDEIVVYF
jgi:hypothetical protein